MKQTQNLFSLTLTFLSFSIFLFTSCKYKEEQAKIENVCTLTTAQAPEVRGFRLGMTLEQVVNKYPRLCKMPQQIPQYDVNVTFFIRDYQVKKEEAVRDCSQYNLISLSGNEFPELNGVEEIELKIIKNHLSSIEIRYNSTSDENFAKEFTNKIKDSLNLSVWTNWEIKNEEKFSRDYGVFTSTKTENNQLLCNKVIFKTEMQKTHSTPLYASDNRARLQDARYSPSLFLYESEETAISEFEKKQKQLEIRNAEAQRKEEDKKKSETFKP